MFPLSSLRPDLRPRVGVFGIGLAAYWPQFHGLKERLEGYQSKVEQRIGQWATVGLGGDEAGSLRRTRDARGKPQRGERNENDFAHPTRLRPRDQAPQGAPLGCL